MFEWLKNLFKPFRRDKERHIKSDVLGSYTGVAENPDEKPTQDADDL